VYAARLCHDRKLWMQASAYTGGSSALEVSKLYLLMHCAMPLSATSQGLNTISQPNACTA